jgi:hypothetical protein
MGSKANSTSARPAGEPDWGLLTMRSPEDNGAALSLLIEPEAARAPFGMIFLPGEAETAAARVSATATGRPFKARRQRPFLNQHLPLLAGRA